MLVLAALAAFGALSKIGPKRLINVGLVLLFFGGLAVTVSRSATIGFIAAVAAAAALSREQLFGAARKVDPRALRRTALFALGIVVAATVILAGSGLAGLVIRTLANLPNAYHIVDSVEAIEFLAQQPQGVGMGLVEPKGALSLIEAGGTYHVEGSLFQIAMEMGVWGLAIWLAFWALALARIWRSWPRLQTPELRVLAGAAFAGWIGSLVAFVFLPLMQSISLMVWLWFLLGIGYASESIEKGWSAFSAATGD